MKKSIISFSFLSIMMAIVITIIILWEPSNFKSSSLAYYIKVSPEIRSKEIINTASTPLYTVRNSDGIKPAMTIIKYCSNSPVNEIYSKLIKNQHSCNLNTDFDGIVCRYINSKYDVTSVIEKGKSCTSIFINYSEIQ